MNENLVCTIQTAKKLKMLGAPQDGTAFLWYQNAGTYELLYSPDMKPMMEKSFAAYTASEVSNNFPKEIWVVVGEKSYRRREAMLYFVKHNNLYKCSLMIKQADNKDFFELHREEDSNEAEARCRMYAYLLENNMLEVKA